MSKLQELATSPLAWGAVLGLALLPLAWPLLLLLLPVGAVMLLSNHSHKAAPDGAQASKAAEVRRQVDAIMSLLSCILWAVCFSESATRERSWA